MAPLPYPHRATFLASRLHLPAELEHVRASIARLLSLIVFDHLVRHPVVTLGDHDDERLVDDTGRLLDADHPQAEDSIDWFFRVSRRADVLWFELSLDPRAPAPPVLRARAPSGRIEAWGSSSDLALSQQLGQCLAGWLSTRHLPSAGSLAAFTLADLRLAAERLTRIEAMLAGGAKLARLAGDVTEPPPRLAIPFLRVLGQLAADEGKVLDAAIAKLDPAHVVTRRNRYVAGVLDGTIDRRAILPLLGEAPMYAKPHLAIWGAPFAGERVLENMGVRHQGIAASLMPANPYACHNYSLQLAEHGRREESYRWADRATVAASQFGAAHLDCVRRLRQVGRPAQAFAEAQYRWREIQERATAGTLAPADPQALHHAALLIAFAHLDIGRLAEAIELADQALANVPAELRDAFAWARKRVAHWKTDAGLLARAYAWEGHHRGDPGRVLAGLSRVRLADDEEAGMWLDALVTIGRFEQAEIAYWHCAGIDGAGVLGDGKARLRAAAALILAGDLDEALDQLQIAQLRRSQSRLEAEINRVLRLAAIHPASAWEGVIARRLERGALQLAQLGARDLADFVPGLATPQIEEALGDRMQLALDPAQLAGLAAALPAATTSAAAILDRLAMPAEDSLRAADALASEWWTVLVPPARDRDAHAAGAVLSLGVSLASYLVLASGPPSPLAGAYRHIATEALHLVRRSRYQIEPPAIGALLRLVDAFGDAPEWLLDTWLLRIERALDLEAEHGAYLESMIAGLPTVQRLLRGDERIGWELRMAHDLAADPSQYEPAGMLFARCQRAIEGGSVELAWAAAAAAAGAPAAVQLDLHWLAALANPTGVAAPWLRLAHELLGSGRASAGFSAACRGLAATTPAERGLALESLAPVWRTAEITTPLPGDAALAAGRDASTRHQHELAIDHLRWAVAIEPGSAERAQLLAHALARTGRGLDAIRVLAPHEPTEAPRQVGRLLHELGRDGEAVPILRYAARRFRTAEDWVTLALAASRAEDDATVVEAGRHALALGARDPGFLAALATGLYRIGEFVECEQIAQQLISEGRRDARLAGLHAMARALAGQGRHVDAHPYAKAAAELAPQGALAAELLETMDLIVAQQEPPVRASAELSMERRACADLEAGRFDLLTPAISSPSWGIARVALAACEFRTEDENGLTVAPRALDAADAVFARTAGTTDPEATLARIRALRIRDHAFIQIDPPPPLGARYTVDDFDRLYAERDRRPHRPSAALSFAR